MIISAVLAFGACLAAGLWFFAPSSEPYRSPATLAFVSLGVRRPPMACDDGMLLGGGMYRPIAGVTRTSSDEEIADHVSDLLATSGRPTRDAFRLWRAFGVSRVYVAASGRARASAAVVVGPSDGSIGTPPSAVGDVPEPTEGLAVRALAFCG